MADKAKQPTQAELDAERKKREEQEELQAQIQKEEDELRAKAADQAISAPGAVVTTLPVEQPSARIILKPEAVRKADERYQAYSVLVDGVNGTPEQVRNQVLAIVNDAGFLWPVHQRIAPGGARFAEVTLHDAIFSWEVKVRVMRIDADLHLVQTSQIGPIVVNSVAASKIDWSAIQITHRGAIGKWSLTYKGALLKDGFDTEQAAQNFLNAKKVMAA